MKRGTDHDLMRLLHGEMPAEEARVLRGRLETEPALAAAYRRLEETWQGLSLPPAAPVPLGFAGRVMARLRSRSVPGTSWSAAPAWVRAMAAAALVAGAALGVGVGRSWPAPQPDAAGEIETASLSTSADEDYSLADSYWNLMADAATGSAAEAKP